MTTTQQTLSVVLSVHNAEKTLSRQVNKLLDMLPDLAQRFEVLILDDGSTDQTEEVAHELAKDYPQLHVVHHNERRGTDASLQTALEMATGDVVVLQNDQGTAGLRSALERCDQMATQSSANTGSDPIGGPRRTGESRHADWIIARRADFGAGKSPRPLSSRQFFRV